MKTSHLAALVIAAALCGAGGFYLARQQSPATRIGADTSANAGETAGPFVPGMASPLPAASPGAFDLGANVQRARDDAEYLRKLLADYRHATDADARGAKLAVLESIQNDEVRQAALDMAASSDRDTKLAGIALLKGFPLSDAKVRDFLTTQLAAERDPSTLQALVGIATPGSMASEDATPVADRLMQLTSHADPGVRSKSIVQAAVWEADSARTRRMLEQALLDPSSEIRQAAISATLATRQNSPHLKDSLLSISMSPGTPDEERNAALFALQNFSLNRAEHELYTQAIAKYGDHDDHGKPH